MSEINQIHLEYPIFEKLYLWENFDCKKLYKKFILIGDYCDLKFEKNKKDYNMKIINVHSAYKHSFEAYITQLHNYIKMMEITDQNNYLFKIEAFSIKETTFYIIQKRHDQPIKQMEELQAYVVLRALVQFYNQIGQQQLNELFDMFYTFGVIGPSLETVFYYYNSSAKKKLNRSKIKLDLLQFKEIDNKIDSYEKTKKKNDEDFYFDINLKKTKENPSEKIHMRELGDLMLTLLNSENIITPGLCTRTLLNRIKNDKTCIWEKIFLHPIFCQNKTITPDLEYWKIQKNDRNYMRDEERKVNSVINLNKKSKKDYDLHRMSEESPLNKTSKIHHPLEEKKEKLTNSSSKIRGVSANIPYNRSMREDLEDLEKILKKYKDKYRKEFDKLEVYIIVAMGQCSEIKKNHLNFSPHYKEIFEDYKKNKIRYNREALEKLLNECSFFEEDLEKKNFINLLSNLKVF